MRRSDMTEDQIERARAYGRKWYQENKEYMRAYGYKYRRDNPTKVRTLVKEWGKRNPESKRASSLKWVHANPDKKRAKDQRYRQAHPENRQVNHRKRRAIKNGQSEHFTKYEWKLLCEQYNNHCLRCGQLKPLTADHVIPLVMGGADTIDNIQPLCGSCNSSKGTQIIDYRNRQPIRVEQLSFLGMTQ